MQRRTEKTVRRLLEEFRAAVEKLPSLMGNRSRLKEVITQCCEVSRDIRLFAGPPQDASDELIQDIHAAMVLACEALQKQNLSQFDVPDSREPSLSAYLSNIEHRAKIFADLIGDREKKSVANGSPATTDRLAMAHS